MIDLAAYFGLVSQQAEAVHERHRDVIVTAGAGSGKTRTLVVRYLSLLADGLDPQWVIAITFTEKAAREMRNRLYQYTNDLITETRQTPEAARWLEISARLDGARIGTFHSLCAEILRNHPAEAGIDPRFGVLDENETAALRAMTAAQCIESAVSQEELSELFKLFKVGALTMLVQNLLNQRLEASPALQTIPDIPRMIQNEIQHFIELEEVRMAVETLAELHSSRQLLASAGPALTPKIEALLTAWQNMAAAVTDGKPYEAALMLFNIRRIHLTYGNAGKAGLAKDAAKDLKTIYDKVLDPWLGGSASKDKPPCPEEELAFAAAYPGVQALYRQAEAAYRQRLNALRSLDFDDLEEKALTLLQDPAIRQHWQTRVQAVLVDEFQDTNQRQREIVDALCGDQPGRLFVVGDDRQSIYRFRGADVTVFRRLRDEIDRKGGLVIPLRENFRTHPELLDAAADLLKTIMGHQEDPQRPYHVPFSQQESRGQPPKSAASPYIQFILGQAGEGLETRPAAADALVQHLLNLHDAGEIGHWDDVALLFRASTGFLDYEDALHAAGIPFVTVAGRGFYDRPEIRDILNLLNALANPWEDLYMAGALRSPGFGLSDAALYQLRLRHQPHKPLWQELKLGPEGLAPEMQGYARRAVRIIDQLLPDVDRIPVGDLLQELLSLTDYRAILASQHSRLGRNIDKLVADAGESGIVNVRAFLEFVQTLSDTGGREGEAVADAEGAVRLMTIHKSKGLEFPVVVLADATYTSMNRGAHVYFYPPGSFSFQPSELESKPLIYRLGKAQDDLITEAEIKRLLYVAMTRAEHKLLVCGAFNTKGVIKGWISELLKASSIDIKELASQPDSWLAGEIESHLPVSACLYSPGNIREMQGYTLLETVPLSNQALYRPLQLDKREVHDPETEEPAGYHMRITGEGQNPPAVIVGNLVHRALQNWKFPGDPGLHILLESAAIREGLVTAHQREAALSQADILLSRFRTHPIWEEINNALERHHEVPFSLQRGERLDIGAIDLLYRLENGWHLLDYKTDELNSPEALTGAVHKHRGQLNRYISAFQTIHGPLQSCRICFLDYMRQVKLEPI